MERAISIVVVYDDKEFVNRVVEICKQNRVEVEIIRLSPLGSLMHAINSCKHKYSMVIGWKNIDENFVSVRLDRGFSNVKNIRMEDFDYFLKNEI